jgi:hypothetical protein
MPSVVVEVNVPMTSPNIGGVPDGGFGQVPEYPGPQAEAAADGPLRTTPPKFNVSAGSRNGLITISEDAPVAELVNV